METSEQKTKQQRGAIVAKFITEVAPTEVPKNTLEKQVREWRHELVELRKKGYSAEQIVTFLARPEINIQASVWTVKKVLASAPRKHATNASEATLNASMQTPAKT